MGALLPLCISFIGIVLLLLLKFWENRNGRVYFPRAREKADRAVLRVASVLERGVQKMLRAFSRRVVIGSLQVVAERSLQFLQWVERKLLRLISMIRGQKGTTRKVQTLLQDNPLHTLRRSHKKQENERTEKRTIE